MLPVVLALALQAAPDAKAAQLDALRWLARHQDPDGAWSVQAYVDRCAGTRCSPNPGWDEFKTGVTALALLAFVTRGTSHRSKETHDGIVLGDVVRKGLTWLLSKQGDDGFIGERRDTKATYAHAVAALALAEAFGLTRSNLIKDQAQKAADYLVAAQNPGRGWRYTWRSGDNDTSVTLWAVLALQAAERAGLAVPASTFRDAVAWIDEATDANGRTGYTFAGSGKVFIPGLCEHFDHHETLTAAAMLCRLLVLKDPADVRHSQGARLLARDLPRWDGAAIDFFYWFVGTEALRRLGADPWPAWRDGLLEALLKAQNRAGDKAGSWEPLDRWSPETGRVYATAINALTLGALAR